MSSNSDGRNCKFLNIHFLLIGKIRSLEMSSLANRICFDMLKIRYRRFLIDFSNKNRNHQSYNIGVSFWTFLWLRTKQVKHKFSSSKLLFVAIHKLRNLVFTMWISFFHLYFSCQGHVWTLTRYFPSYFNEIIMLQNMNRWVSWKILCFFV